MGVEIKIWIKTEDNKDNTYGQNGDGVRGEGQVRGET